MSNKKRYLSVFHLSVIQIIYVIKNIYAFNKGAGAPPHPPLILKRFLLYLLLYFFICLHLLVQICLLLLRPLLRLLDFLFEPNKEPTKPLREKEPDAIIK
jgi:hypothetical protein